MILYCEEYRGGQGWSSIRGGSDSIIEPSMGGVWEQDCTIKVSSLILVSLAQGEESVGRVEGGGELRRLGFEGRDFWKGW